MIVCVCFLGEGKRSMCSLLSNVSDLKEYERINVITSILGKELNIRVKAFQFELFRYFDSGNINLSLF